MQRLEDRIVEQAKTWLGVKFRHAGRNRNGVDCIGLIIKVAHELDLTDYDTKQYARNPNVNYFLRELKREMKMVPLKEMGHGHVIITTELNYPVHCGILEVDENGRKWMIHSYQPFGGVRREALEQFTRGREVKHAFAYKESA